MKYNNCFINYDNFHWEFSEEALSRLYEQCEFGKFPISKGISPFLWYIIRERGVMNVTGLGGTPTCDRIPYNEHVRLQNGNDDDELSLRQRQMMIVSI